MSFSLSLFLSLCPFARDHRYTETLLALTMSLNTSDPPPPEFGYFLSEYRQGVPESSVDKCRTRFSDRIRSAADSRTVELGETGGLTVRAITETTAIDAISGAALVKRRFLNKATVTPAWTRARLWIAHKTQCLFVVDVDVVLLRNAGGQ